jgi:hypothetical protein
LARRTVTRRRIVNNEYAPIAKYIVNNECALIAKSERGSEAKIGSCGVAPVGAVCGYGLL